jgi:hypothetical protein
VQQCLEWFKDLGYAYAFAPDLAPDGTTPERTDFRQVILTGRLRSATCCQLRVLWRLRAANTEAGCLTAIAPDRPPAPADPSNSPSSASTIWVLYAGTLAHRWGKHRSSSAAKAERLMLYLRG